MKIKRILTTGVAGLLLASTLVSCSAYKNPSKYIELPEKGAATISAAEIKSKLDEQINDILEDGRDSNYVELEDEDATVQKGDQVAIYYKGTLVDESVDLTEKEIAGMTNIPAEGEEGDPHDLVIGSNSFIGAYEDEEDPEKNTEGFEEQLIGHKKGDKFTILVTFPDNYGTTVFQGQQANFEIEIVSISRNTIDDESTIGVDYTFEDITDAEEPEDNNGEDVTTPETGDDEDADVSEAAEEADKDDEDEDADAPETDEDEDDEIADIFADLFKDGDFEIDYTADKIKGKFNDLFSIADYAEFFKGQNVYYEYTFTYIIPEDVDEKYKELIGREVKVTLTVCEVTSLPEWNDEYVAEYTSDEYKTVEEYTEFLETNIKQQLAYEAILGAANVKDYPMREVKKTYKTYVDTYVSQELGGRSPSDYTNSELKKILTDEVYEKIYANAAASAFAAVKERLVVEALIEELNIELSNKEYKEKRAEYYADYQIYFMYYYGITSEKALEKYYGKDALKLQFLTEKLYEVIVDYVEIVD